MRRKKLVAAVPLLLSALLLPGLGCRSIAPAGGGGEAESLNPPPGSPTVAICVDDVGNGDDYLPEWLAIEAPLTFAILPYSAKTTSDAQTLQAAGQQVLLHLPEENDPPHSFSGQGQVTCAMEQASVDQVLDADAAQIPGMVGLNNHQGGKAGNDIGLQRRVVDWARRHGVFVLDSNASSHPVAYIAAGEVGMPVRISNIFLDDETGAQSIRDALRLLAAKARVWGTAIGICHFARPGTAAVMGEMIPVLQAEGIRFEFVSNVTNHP